MSRGNKYPCEGFDGSPFYLGKKRKPTRIDGTAKTVMSPLTEANVNTSIDEIIIDDQDSDPEIPAKRMQSLPVNCILKSKGTLFDFSADEDVRSLNRAVMAVIDPEGKRKNDIQFQQRSIQNIANKKEEILNDKSKKKGPKTWNYKDLSADFRMASGSAVVKEVKKVVPPEIEKQLSSSSQGEKYLGNKKIVPNSCNNGVNGITKKAVLMGMTNDGGGRDKVGLRADPTLKNFDENIISLIECEIMSMNTETGWSDVAGLQGAKKALREIVVLPFKRPDIFKGIRAPPKGVLLFGPPGTGKTMIGRCVASQCKATFFNISASSLTSKWVGEGEKLVRALFAVARVKLPSVIFIDEIDSLLSARSESEHESSRRIKTEFLVQLDGIATNSEEKLLVIGATNRPYELDEAARRRFAKRLYIALPDNEARLCIVRNLLDDMDHTLSARDYEQIGNLTDGYSGADMRQLCSEAAMGPIREIDAIEGADIETFPTEKIRPISGHDFTAAARNVRPTVAPEDLTVYNNWNKKFGYCKFD